MNSPKKPEFVRNYSNQRKVEDIEKAENYAQGYNQACFDWQLYHDHIISQLPNEQERKGKDE